MDQEKTFVLIGAPNSGKTTFYNWLTGSNFKTVNYPGSTVEYSIGKVNNGLAGNLSKELSSAHISFIDTPGTYSLIPKGPDEEVTNSVLFDAEIKNKKVLLDLKFEDDRLHAFRIRSNELESTDWTVEPAKSSQNSIL